MENTKTVFNQALMVGLVLGITLSAFELIGYFLGILSKPIMGYINIAIVTTMIILAIRKFREQNHGIISFGDAFLLSFFISLISGAIWSLYRFAEYSIAPEIIEDMLIAIEDKLLESNISEDQIEVLMNLYIMIFKAPILAFSTFLFNMGFGGAILSLILAAIFKRDGNPMLTNTQN